MQMVTTTPTSSPGAESLQPGMAAVTVLPPHPVTLGIPAGKTVYPLPGCKACVGHLLSEGTEALEHWSLC
jgi:hypothetical protein